jgi:hypothetical protein
MQWDSALELKASLRREDLVAKYLPTPQDIPAEAAAVRATALAESPKQSAIAIGISGRRNKYRLAVRVQRTVPGLEGLLDHIRKRSRGEMDVRQIGRVVKQEPWHQRRNRPLRIGGSIGHVDITAGTLGSFVTRRSGDGSEDLILSNNHVLANENHARRGDAIIQPGDADGGRAPADRVGSLEAFVRLKKKNNSVDVAIASMNDGLEYYYNMLETIGTITGVRSDPLDEGEVVQKVGRTTGVTKGRVSAIEVDDLVVEYDDGDLEFNGQIEIAPDNRRRPFSLGGDSGSLIVDSRRRAVGLLFAGNDVDATFANPIGAVLDSLKVDLVY